VSALEPGQPGHHEVRRLAVLGDPVAHSRSPELHAAAYRVLGLDWSYTAVRLPAIELGGFVDELGPEWRGLSLTMPHKQVVLPLLDERDPVTELVGAANTLLFADDGRRVGVNTDVEGVVRALDDHGVVALESVQILGGGATAQSVLAAVASLGASAVQVHVRDPGKGEALRPLAERLGLDLVVRRLGMQDRSLRIPDLVVSTLPGHAEYDFAFPEAVRAESVLFDVAYDPWPSRLAAAWGDAGGTVVSGLEMLLHQAVAQVRVFVGGTADAALDREDEVRAAMRAAVGLPEVPAVERPAVGLEG